MVTLQVKCRSSGEASKLELAKKSEAFAVLIQMQYSTSDSDHSNSGYLTRTGK